jgi:hypothetical protein
MAWAIHRYSLRLGLLSEWDDLVSNSVNQSESADDQYRNDLCMYLDLVPDQTDDIVPSSKTDDNQETWTHWLLRDP